MSAMSVSTEIAAQLGGVQRLEVMIGAEGFCFGGSSLVFRFKGCRRANFCRIEYLPALDLYRMSLHKYPKVEPVVEFDSIFCDQLIELFEDATGLFLFI